MSKTGVKLIGHDKLMRHMSQMETPRLTFDAAYSESASWATREFGDATSKMTGNTARGWQIPKKLGLSSYEVFNNIKTTNKKYLIVEILDQGRKEVVAKEGKTLYIPITEKGRSKKSGAKIPKGFVFGVDYVFSKKSKKVDGLNFKAPILKSSSKVLTRAIIIKIRSVHSGI